MRDKLGVEEQTASVFAEHIIDGWFATADEKKEKINPLHFIAQLQSEIAFRSTPTGKKP